MAERPSPKRAVLLDALDQELRRRPRGTIRAMEVALGWAPTWWHNRLRSGDITTGQALAVLEHLGIDRSSRMWALGWSGRVRKASS